MAHENAKKNAKKNHTRMMLFIQISVGITVVCFAMQIFTFSSITAFSSIMWALFWVAHYGICIYLLNSRGKPVMENGEIVDCVDLSDPTQLNIFSYAQDVLWICWTVHLLHTLLAWYFILLYFPIPLFAAYKIFSGVIGPMLSVRNSMNAQKSQKMEDDPRTRLVRRREEMQARRAGIAKKE